MHTAVPRTLGISLLAAVAATSTAQEPVRFIRGDANADGTLSTADILTIQRWLFGGDPAPPCIDAADVDDDGRVDLCDAIGVATYLFATGSCSHNGVPVEYGTVPPAPFPAAGEDPTADTEPYMSCLSFELTPAVATEDVLRLGDIDAPGGEVEIPVYVGNAQPVEAVQIVLRYDPTILRIETDPEAPFTGAIDYAGTHYEQFIGQRFTEPNGFFTYGGPFTFAQVHPADGIFTVSIVPDILGRGHFTVPAGGPETLVAKIRATVSPDVAPGTSIPIDPVDGLDGAGYGPFRLRNEFTYAGVGRYPTVVPRTVGALLRIGVDGDVSFFFRGDANRDARVDISDPVFILDYLFLGGDEPPCLDAADSDDDGTIIITDAIAILSTLFVGVSAIAPPFPDAGPDVKPDFLPRCSKP